MSKTKDVLEGIHGEVIRRVSKYGVEEEVLKEYLKTYGEVVKRGFVGQHRDRVIEKLTEGIYRKEIIKYISNEENLYKYYLIKAEEVGGNYIGEEMVKGYELLVDIKKFQREFQGSKYLGILIEDKE